MRFGRQIGAVAAIALAASLGGGSARYLGGLPPESPPRPPSIVLVSIDTLRPDHLSCYGYPRDTSPAVDRFARDAVRFEAAFAHAPSTLPSHASLFTSLLPGQHGASFARGTPLRPDVPTLAGILADHGYRTLAWTGGGQLDPKFGVDRGFDLYDARVGYDAFQPVVDHALRWLDERTDQRPFFWFLHTYEVHHPYRPDPVILDELDPGARQASDLRGEIGTGLLKRLNDGRLQRTPERTRYVRAAYDAGIRSMDQAWSRLLRGLRDRGLYDDLLIVFTSDHGEELGEHGKIGWHSHTLYDELLRVPLLIKLPANRRSGTVVRDQVRLVDVAPTILDVAGVPPPPELAGRSLGTAIEGWFTSRLPLVARRDTRSGNSAAVRMGGWKLYDDRLFDLRLDPGETTDLSRERPRKAAAMRDLLEALVARRKTPSGSERPVDLDPEAQRRLEALGYL